VAGVEVRLAAGTLGLMVFGWALVTAADARYEAKHPVYETFVQPVVEKTAWEQALEVETPLLDSLVDWEEVERQTDCLWEFMQAAGVEITLEVVLAAGTWTDALGGACLVIGEDDE
jgi:hypothetical protein